MGTGITNLSALSELMVVTILVAMSLAGSSVPFAFRV